MSEGMPYADIIILALIAGFILLRLRNVLGQNSNTDADQPKFFSKDFIRPEEPEEPVVHVDEKSLKSKPKEEKDLYLQTLGNTEITEAVATIKARDPFFTATSFLEGAKLAFEMVFDGFAKGDKNTLRMLMSDSVYQHFNDEIDAREKQDNKTEVTLVAVNSKDLLRAEMTGNTARLTVKFVSEQVTVVRNPKGEIIQGDVSNLDRVEDEWVFERDVTSKNPIWKIIET